MKKTILFLIVTMVILCCVGCGEKNNTPQNEIPSETASDKNDQISSDNISDKKEWGVQESIVAGKNDELTTAYIKFPSLSGIVRGTGKIAYQKDKTLVILDAERKTGSPKLSNNSCDNVFPAYFEQTKNIIDAYRQMNYQDFEFNIEGKKDVVINDYEMCKYFGKHTFTVNGEKTEINYVAYAAKLKGNDAVIYWMVLDESEDQSLSSVINEYAQKMASTLSE